MVSKPAKPLLAVFLAVGTIFLRSSISKFSSGNFPITLGETLTKTMDKNPLPFFKQFLNTVVIPNSVLFGNLIMWGELLTALAIIGGSVWILINAKRENLAILLLLAGLVGGLFLNINFWFGFGNTSPSADSLNLLMIVIEIIGIISLTRK